MPPLQERRRPPNAAPALQPRLAPSLGAHQTLNAFTVDVEDYFQVTAFEHSIARQHWKHYESRVVSNTRTILRLLDRHRVKATFFVLGWTAEHYPGLVREIDRYGHEIGSHSYWHRLVYEQTPEEFRDDLCRSRDLLQNILGRPITAYRAPSFSITNRSFWATEILSKEGFQVDSSIYPIHHDRYGIPGARRDIHRIDTFAGPLWEFPPAVWTLGRLNLPVSGGGYFRLYPIPWSSYCLRQANKQHQPFMFYIHPWEVDPAQPRITCGSRLSQFRHRVNLKKTEAKLDRLLGAAPFGSISDVFAQQGVPVGATTSSLKTPKKRLTTPGHPLDY